MVAPLDARKSNPRNGGPSFSFGHRLERLVFQFVWKLAELLCPIPLHSVRRSILKAFGANIHPTAKIYPGVRVWYPRNLFMAEFSCLGPGVNCYCMAPITLGVYALVSQGAYLCAGSHDIDDPDFQLVIKPISLEASSWVAAEAFVGPGAVVGEGAVLGARGVLFRSLEPWTVAVGNPARVLRKRVNNIHKESI